MIIMLCVCVYIYMYICIIKVMKKHLLTCLRLLLTPLLVCVPTCFCLIVRVMIEGLQEISIM